MDERVKGLLKDLGEAIDKTVTESPRIESIMQAIRDSGYEVYLMLQANIAVENRQKKPSGESNFSEDDKRFLKRLRIQL